MFPIRVTSWWNCGAPRQDRRLLRKQTNSWKDLQVARRGLESEQLREQTEGAFGISRAASRNTICPKPIRYFHEAADDTILFDDKESIVFLIEFRQQLNFVRATLVQDSTKIVINSKGRARRNLH